jgi:hypothetical protein
MSRRHSYRPVGHSYRELIATVQESAVNLVEQQMTRDREWFAYEKQKLVLLILMFLSLWIMFFLLWEKLDDFRSDAAPPAMERSSSPDPITLPSHRFDEPMAIHYVL